MTFKVGDKVKITNFGSDHVAFLEKGSIHEIIEVDELDKECTYQLNDGCTWVCDSEIERVEFTKNDLKEGDRATTRNNEILFLHNGRFERIGDGFLCYPIDDLNNKLKNKKEYEKDWDIIKVERPVYETIYEREDDNRTKMTIEEVEEKYGIKVVGGNE